MPRLLKGHIKARGARFQASVPLTHGTSERAYANFDTRVQAEAWCALAVAAIEAGQSIPPAEAVTNPTWLPPSDPNPILPTRSMTLSSSPEPAVSLDDGDPMPTVSRSTMMTVAEIAADWFAEVYIDGRSASAERAARVEANVRRHVVAFLAPILDSGQVLTREAYRAHLAALGRPKPEPGKRGRGRPATPGMAQDTIRDIRRCLDGVLRHGIQLGAWTLPFDTTDVRTPRTRRPKTPKSAGLSLTEVAAIAEHMHAVHQLTLWACRILTLRIGEAYGIKVGDLAPTNDGTGRGLLWLHAQGGRVFTVADGDRLVRTDHKEGMKHEFSERMQLVPAPLMALFGDAIEVFHTDPGTGNVNLDARLIPGLHRAGISGQHGFRHALARASQEAGVVKTAINGFERVVVGTPTPKDLRASAVTDLEWVPGLDPTALRRFAGHAPGTDVHALHYVIDRPGNAKAIEVCEALERLIAIELPAGLRIPTAVPCTTRVQPELNNRAHHIDDRLRALCWLVTDTGDVDNSDPWLGVADVAALLDQSPVTIRRWVREGRLPARMGKSNGSIGHRIRQSAVVAFTQAENTRVTLADMQEHTGVNYHRLHRWIQRFQLAHEQAGERGVALPQTTVDELVRLAHLEHSLQQAGMTYADAARELGVQSRTIAVRVDLGVLESLPELGPDGRPYVTRVSVQLAKRRPSLMRTRPNRRRK